MILSLVVFFTAICGETLHSAEYYGPGLSGGGDPSVAQFLMHALKIQRWLERGGEYEVHVSALEFEKVVSELRASLGIGRRSQVWSSSEKLYDDMGVEKPALFITASRSIALYTSYWQSLQNRSMWDVIYLQVAQEVLGLMGDYKNRYERAALISQHAREINQIVLTIEDILNASNGGLEGLNGADPDTWPPFKIFPFAFSKILRQFEIIQKNDPQSMIQIQQMDDETAIIRLHPAADLFARTGPCELRSLDFLIKITKVAAKSVRVQINSASKIYESAVSDIAKLWLAAPFTPAFPYSLQLKTDESSLLFRFLLNKPGRAENQQEIVMSRRGKHFQIEFIRTRDGQKTSSIYPSFEHHTRLNQQTCFRQAPPKEVK